MKIIVATDSFKGSITAKGACKIIADSLSKYLQDAEIITNPMADGGEGTADTVMAANNGRRLRQEVTGPLADMQVEADFVWLEKKNIALVEMACASGITLLKKKQLNPLKTTTYGTGELIKKAAEKQPDEILLAVGGSATVDMGVGAAMAMGWQFLDSQNNPVGLGGECLEQIEQIIPPVNKFNHNLKVLSDVNNPLYGPNGAAEIFGPQKGANQQTVKRLDAAIERLSNLVEKQLGLQIADIPGAGAAGGLAAGAVAFMNAEIVSGIEAIINVTNLRDQLTDSDWIITGEGKFDHQSLNGKVICGIVNAAKQANTKIAVIAGNVEIDKSEYEKFGISDAFSLKKDSMTTEYAMTNCKKLLEESAARLAAKILKR